MDDFLVKRVVVLGSTGSVGTQTLDVVRGMPGRFRVVGLSAQCRWQLLAEQVQEFGADMVAIGDKGSAAELAAALNGRDIRVLRGPTGLQQMAGWEGVDVVVSAVSGNAGLPAAVAALRHGTTLALANKESVVMAGPLLTQLAEENGAAILPVDSEHSAIFQLLAGVRLDDVEKVILTASGGPFYGCSQAELATVTPEQALKHPTWSMGRKISVDSATLMNKALEIIEARWLFGLPPEKIGVLIHPQSIVHSLVAMKDGAVFAHMSAPDMKLPIKYALNYPARVEGVTAALDLAQVGRLDFAEPDLDAFPALELGYHVATEGGTSGAALSAANEEAVHAFLDGRLGFTDIVRVVRQVLDRHDVQTGVSLEDLAAVDLWAREEAVRCLQAL